MSVQIRNPELVRLLAADFVTRRELVTTPGNRVTLTNSSLTVSGGGDVTLSAAGDYTLTIPKTGTVPVGTGTAGRIAEWVTDANTVQASTLAKSGAGVLTLSAAGDYTLTVPGTGTAALLGTANVFTADQTINGLLRVVGNSGIQLEDASTSTSGPFLYIVGPGQTTSGANASEFLAMVGGPGSSSWNDGPYFFLRGNTYTRNANQRGALGFLAGNVATPTGLDGVLLFASPASYIDFQTTTSSTSRMRILNDGRVGIGNTSPATSALLELSSTTGALLLPRMTSAQRDALTAVNGMIIYNSTTGTVQAYAGGSWTSL